MSQSLDTEAITPHPRRLREYSNNFASKLVVLVAAAVVFLVAVAFAEPEDACAEHLARWGTRAPGCPKPTAGDRWSRDQARRELDVAVSELGIGDELLWIDREGNVGLRIPVERAVYFDRGGRPIGAAFVSERCRRSLDETLPYPSIVLCLEDDRLRRLVDPE